MNEFRNIVITIQDMNDPEKIEKVSAGLKPQFNPRNRVRAFKSNQKWIEQGMKDI